MPFSSEDLIQVLRKANMREWISKAVVRRCQQWDMAAIISSQEKIFKVAAIM